MTNTGMLQSHSDSIEFCVSAIKKVCVREGRKSGRERRQSKVLCKTRLILLSVCQAVLIWPGLHRDKVLVMNLSKRI